MEERSIILCSIACTSKEVFFKHTLYALTALGGRSVRSSSRMGTQTRGRNTADRKRSRIIGSRQPYYFMETADAGPRSNRTAPGALGADGGVCAVI